MFSDPAESEPTKPSKPGFVGFVGAHQGVGCRDGFSARSKRLYDRAMLVCQHCGTPNRDPGDDPRLYTCGKCGCPTLYRPATPPANNALAGAAVGAAIGGAAGGPVGALFGIIIGGVLGNRARSPLVGMRHWPPALCSACRDLAQSPKSNGTAITGRDGSGGRNARATIPNGSSGS
jgi:hypothetical protein